MACEYFVRVVTMYHAIASEFSHRDPVDRISNRPDKKQAALCIAFTRFTFDSRTSLA